MPRDPSVHLPGDPRCPACGTLLDGAMSIALDGKMPKSGDATICAYCATLLVFGDDLHPRFPNDTELAETARLPEVEQARAVVLEVIRRRGATDA